MNVVQYCCLLPTKVHWNLRDILYSLNGAQTYCNLNCCAWYSGAIYQCTGSRLHSLWCTHSTLLNRNHQHDSYSFSFWLWTLFKIELLTWIISSSDHTFPSFVLYKWVQARAAVWGAGLTEVSSLSGTVQTPGTMSHNWNRKTETNWCSFTHPSFHTTTLLATLSNKLCVTCHMTI